MPARPTGPLRRARLSVASAVARVFPQPARVAAVARRLLARDRIEEAEALLLRGLDVAPDDPDLLEQFAFCAHNSGRYKEALARWTVLCEVRPDLVMAWCGVSSNARELGRYDQATAAVDEALARFPADRVVLIEAARVREACGAHAEAVDLWRRLLACPGAGASWHVALLANLMPLDRFDEAQAVVDEVTAGEDTAGRQRARARMWGKAAEIAARANRVRLMLYASESTLRFGEEAYATRQVAETTTDLEAARACLRRMVEAAPRDFEARESYARVLLRLDAIEEAERHIAIGLKQAPALEPFHALRGLLAIRQGDWGTAHAIASMLDRDPVFSHMMDRLNRVRELEEAERSRQKRPVPIAPAIRDEPETRQLMLGFESIGQDCEFGTVQRAYGAEPLGLLRWAETDVPSLLAALGADLDGIGLPEHTELVIGPVGEILVRDTRWHLAMHTFLQEDEVSLEALHPKMCRRAAWLRDKLLDELRTGEKVLVYKCHRADADGIAALHEECLRFGPNRMLAICHMAGGDGIPPGDPGSVEEIAPGLFVGYLSRISVLEDLAFDEWAEICRRVQGWESPRTGAGGVLAETVDPA